MSGDRPLPAVKSGKHIYIEGSGNTLASVAADINDAAFCVYTTATTKPTLTVYGTAANIRYFRIRNGGTLTGNGGELLEFNNATNDDTRFYIDAGGHFILNDDFEVNGRADGTTTRPYFWYWYGRVTCNADIPNNKRPLIRGMYRTYIYETTNNNNYPNDIIDLTGAVIGGAAVNNGYAFYIYVMGKVRNHIFKDMIFDESIGTNLDTYGISIPYGIQGTEEITFENIYGERTERLFNITGGSLIKTKDCTVKNTSNSWGVLHYGNSTRESRDFFRDYSSKNKVPYGQNFSYHENLTFEVGNNNNKCNVSYGAQVLLKDPTFLRTSGDAVECKYQGRVMLWGTVTTADGSPWDWQQTGEGSYVNRLQLTILDENDDPVEGANVLIEQFEGKEKLIFTTGADGMLHANYDLKGAMLTYESYYTNTAKEVWSSVSKPHKISIYHDGYEASYGAAVMDQDRSITVNLVPSSAGAVATIENNEELLLV